MVLKRRFRIILLVFVGAILLSGAYFAESYLTGIKGPDVEAYDGLGKYTVREGDSLYSIARKYGVAVNALQQLNHLTSTTIVPGQVLSIPDKPAANWYTVQKGDSLYYIALKYGTTVDALKKANSLKSGLIVPGQVLAIPSGATKPPAAPVRPTQPEQPKQAPAPAPSEKPAADRPLADILKEKGINDPWSQMVIMVDKSDHVLSLYAKGLWLKSYHVELGDGGPGDKAAQGDHKTPEGTFYISEKSVLNPPDYYLGTRWMRLSYPNIEDADRGLQQGIIDQATHDQIVNAINNRDIPPQYTALGGGVGIHGGSRTELGPDWTFGCVGLQDKDVEEFFNYVTVGTPVIIQK
ncbi:MAG: LysM peptidoglycan-binding domain-containing protein [Bacillota bacterium]